MEQKDKGYIKLYRSFFDNKIWQADQTFSEREAWIDLIQSARFEASPITSRIGCYEVTWERGQYPASNRFLMKKWKRSEQWVKSFIGKLKRNGMITTDNTQGVNVITLVNYEKYNGTDEKESETNKGSNNSPNNSLSNSPTQLAHNELQELVTHLVTQQITHLKGLQLTSNSNIKKGEEGNYPKKETSTNVEEKKEPLSFTPSPEYLKFTNWMQANAPYCFKNLKPLTEEELGKLKAKYTGAEIASVIEQIENRKDLRKKYASLYRTVLNWAKNEYNR